MADRRQQEADEFTKEQSLWDAYVQIRREQGFDINRILAEWVNSERQKLTSDAGQRHFSELCRSGCTPQILVGSIALLRFSPGAEKVWSKIVGGPYKRGKAVHSFENAARTIDDLFKDFGTAVNDPKGMEKLHALGRIRPSAISAELHFYARFVTLAERLSKDAEVLSIAALAQYILVGYVQRATGRFHDRATSGLIAEVRGRPAYNEIAQRMWRSRNFARYDKNFGWFIDLIFAFGVVIARTT